MSEIVLLLGWMSFQASFAQSATCVALRGNGNWIGAHFGALAAIVEQEGKIDAIAGGSSSTATAFIYESILANPLVENDDHIALLLKSVYGYLDTSAQSLKDVFTATGNHSILSRTLQTTLQGSPKDLQKSVMQIAEDLKLPDLVNPELLHFLGRHDLSYQYRLNEALEALTSLQSFEAKEPRVFFRPGLINFRFLANIIGYFGDFYAAVNATTHPRMKNWLTECAAKTRSMPWSAIRSSYPNCASELVKQINAAFVLAAKDNEPPQRLNHLVGEEALSMISTAVVHGPKALQQFARRREEFWAGKEIAPLGLDFDEDIRFGYWGLGDQYEQLQNNLQMSFDDAKSQKYMRLGKVTWRQVLRLSPAEPGLASGQEFVTDLGDTMISVGGWSDLHPVQVLRASGCDDVIYVTRSGQEADLARTAALTLGSTPETLAKLYSLDDVSSSFRQAIDGSRSWCTKWNDYDASQILEMSEQAYQVKWSDQNQEGC